MKTIIGIQPTKEYDATRVIALLLKVRNIQLPAIAEVKNGWVKLDTMVWQADNFIFA